MAQSDKLERLMNLVAVLLDTSRPISAEDLRELVPGYPASGPTFPVELPATVTPAEVEQWLSASGFTRVQAEREVATVTGPRKVLDVVIDQAEIPAFQARQGFDTDEDGKLAVRDTLRFFEVDRRYVVVAALKALVADKFGEGK